MEEIKIRDEFIKLGQLLKLADMVQDGVEAKYVITDGRLNSPAFLSLYRYPLKFHPAAEHPVLFRP